MAFQVMISLKTFSAKIKAMTWNESKSKVCKGKKSFYRVKINTVYAGDNFEMIVTDSLH